MAENEKEYIVASPIIYKKKRYEVEPVTMDEETGGPLLDHGFLKEVPAEPEKKTKGAKKPEEGK